MGYYYHTSNINFYTPFWSLKFEILLFFSRQQRSRCVATRARAWTFVASVQVDASKPNDQANDQRIRIITVESAGQFLAKYLQQHCANHTDIKFKSMVAQFDAHELELATISLEFSLKNTVSITVTGYVQLGKKRI